MSTQDLVGSLNTLSVGRTIEDQFNLDVNDLYDYPAERVIRTLASCPLASAVREVSSINGTSGGIDFHAQVGSDFFLGTDIKVDLNIPLKITLATPAGATIDATSFLNLIDNNTLS